ncbi:MAG TPA: DinB family protein [Terriglobales bacterium]
MTSSQIPAWIDRRFNFEFPATLYLNLIARIRGAPPRLEDAVVGLSHEQLIETRDGKWSIQENAGHLLDEEDLFERRLRAYLEGAQTLPPAPYANVKLTHNDRDIHNILLEFRAAREQQVQQLLRLRPEDFGRSAWHARLKVEMRLVDHLVFVAEHDDHHLARIWELRSAITNFD